MRLHIVDAFAERAFAGNPAAVCLLDAPRAEAWMQSVAMELNLSETAFLERREEGFLLRWFTPRVEVALCGHATLASAHVLWEEGELAPEEEARFLTRSGTLAAVRRAGRIEMDFPARPVEAAAAPAGLREALGARAVWTGRNADDWLVEVATPGEVTGLRPDLAALGRIEARGVIVTALGGETDFVSRFFAPAVGVPEDPVTGSAHCALAPYWAARLGRDVLVGHQASARGGFVSVRMRGDRVTLGGTARTVLCGTLQV
ncbi:MAG: PhzF family phenazine biosynthesis protein [Planctomycetaceae bacterium]